MVGASASSLNGSGGCLNGPVAAAAVWAAARRGMVVAAIAAVWDQLLAFTKVPGIYYSDYPVTAALDCPDWTHLSPGGSVIYTKELIRILENNLKWHFPKSIE